MRKTNRILMSRKNKNNIDYKNSFKFTILYKML